jgi:ubiquinone/menaquinone biosynthesis C-methylase UbiE
MVRTKSASGHRGFSAFWDFSTRHEGRGLKEIRQATASGARGRVLELGVGVGANWQYLPEGIAYVGIDPDAYMLERARRHAEERGAQFELHAAPAEALPFPDASFDTVLVTLTLCTVEDPARALAEAGRVLRPQGELRFAEHVRPGGFGGRLADLVAPAWRRLAAGCHPNRDTEAAIRAAGFEVTSLRRERFNGLPTIVGAATRKA